MQSVQVKPRGSSRGSGVSQLAFEELLGLPLRRWIVGPPGRVGLLTDDHSYYLHFQLCTFSPWLPPNSMTVELAHRAVSHRYLDLLVEL